MNHWNLSNLDHAAKRALEGLLRPSYYKLIVPWMARADDLTKKRVIAVARYANKPVKSGQTPTRVTRNTYRLRRSDHVVHKTVDRFAKDRVSRPQTARLAGERAPPLLQPDARKGLEEGFTLGVKPLSEHTWAKLLTPSAKRGLTAWQERAPHPEEAAGAVRTLQSLAEILDRLPNYRKQVTLEVAGTRYRVNHPPNQPRPVYPKRARPKSAPQRLYSSAQYAQQVADLLDEDDAALQRKYYAGMLTAAEMATDMRPAAAIDREWVHAKQAKSNVPISYAPFHSETEYVTKYVDHGPATQSIWDTKTGKSPRRPQSARVARQPDTPKKPSRPQSAHTGGRRPGRQLIEA